MPGFADRMRDYSISSEIKNLADEDGRKSAIRTLKAFGGAAVPLLIEALGDPSRNTYAALVLSDIGEPAIPALLDALGDDSKSAFASVALTEIGKKKDKGKATIIPSLIDALADERKQAIATAALKNFGTPALEPYIPALISNIGNVTASESAARLLIGIGKPAVGPLLNASSDARIQDLVSIILREIAKADSTVHMPAPASQRKTPAPSQTITQSPRPRFCKYCGTSLTSDSVYCPQCGRKVE